MKRNIYPKKQVFTPMSVSYNSFKEKTVYLQNRIKWTCIRAYDER
mgnify:CR=1 FL=1|jgi:hypothetical protein